MHARPKHEREAERSGLLFEAAPAAALLPHEPFERFLVEALGCTPLLEVTVPGKPAGKPRPQMSTISDGKGGVRMNPKNGRAILVPRYDKVPETWAKLAVDCFADAWGGRPPYAEPAAMLVVAYHARPKRLCRRKDPRETIRAGRCKPDVDNCAGIAMDAAKKAGVIVEDARVVPLLVERVYVAIDEGGNPVEAERTEVRLYSVRAW